MSTEPEGESKSDPDIRIPTWAEREAGRPRRLAILARIEAARRGPYIRTRPRNPDEAALLRAKGVPERLIGPDGPSDPDEARAQWLKQQGRTDTRE